MTKFSKKIFHRLSQIPFGIVIHTSRDSNDYFFVGVRDRRKGNECVVYTVPNNGSPKNLNIKAIQLAEFDLASAFLLKNNKLRTRDLEVLTPDLIKEGKCCFAAFYGMINEIYPSDFEKGHGIIYKK
jgi:hypothetical protein